MLAQRMDQTMSAWPPEEPQQTQEERSEQLETALRLVLPMAKAWAAAHDVGANKRIVEDAEAVLCYQCQWCGAFVDGFGLICADCEARKLEEFYAEHEHRLGGIFE